MANQARASLGRQGSPAIHGGIEMSLVDRVLGRLFGLSGDVQGHEPQTSHPQRVRMGQPLIGIRLRYHAGVQEDFQHVPR